MLPLVMLQNSSEAAVRAPGGPSSSSHSATDGGVPARASTHDGTARTVDQLASPRGRSRNVRLVVLAEHATPSATSTTLPTPGPVRPATARTGGAQANGSTATGAGPAAGADSEVHPAGGEPERGAGLPPFGLTTVTVPPTTTTIPAPAASGSMVARGIVTWYDHAPGTCASPWLSFGTVVRVTNPANGESVTCLVDDREADTERSIDLATSTFAEIAPLSQGVIDAQLSW